MVQASFPDVSNLLLSEALNQFITADLDWHIQIVQYLLQQNSFSVIIFISESGADALQDELCGAVQGDRQAVSLS